VFESELRGVSDTAVGGEVAALTEAQAAGMSEDQLLQAAIQVERERERESVRARKREQQMEVFWMWERAK